MVIRGAVAILLAAIGVCTAGCIIIPIPRSTKDQGIRGRVTAVHLEGVRAGETRRRDVLLLLGEPDEVHRLKSATYDCYVTNASRTDVIVGLAIPARAEARFYRASREFLFVKFDHAGVVEKHAFRTIDYSVDVSGESAAPVPVLQEIEEWESGQPRSRPKLGKP